jgi:hypothetical protein
MNTLSDRYIRGVFTVLALLALLLAGGVSMGTGRVLAQNAATGAPAAPLACSGGTNKTADPNTGFTTGQITFCPNVNGSVQLCDYFTGVSGGCPGSDRLANTTITFTCVSGCNNGTFVLDTSTCATLTGITAGTQVVLDYNVTGGVPPNPNGNHGVKNYVQFKDSTGTDELGHACGPSFNENASPTPTLTRTPVSTPTPTVTNTPTATSTPSNTPTATNTPSNTPTATNTPSNTPTATNTPSNTPTATNTPSNTPTATNTPSNTPTATNTPSNTPTATNTPSNTPTASNTPSNTPTATNTPSNTPTATNTPTPSVGQGCSPGFWKNHPEAYPSPYTPNTTLGSVFNLPPCNNISSLANATFDNALNFGGGPTVLDAARILLRQAVAAVLNAAAGIGYPLSVSQVISEVNAALASCNRATILAEAARLDAFNNLMCPLPNRTPTRTASNTPTRTATPGPTNTPTPTCVPETPVVVVTPAFTPGPGCSLTPAPGVVTAAITEHPTTTTAVFTNHSTTCSYPIGLAIYRQFDATLEHQELFDYALAVIPPNSTLTLTVNNPSCAFQADAFYGNLIVSFAGGQTYGTRLLDDTSGNDGNYCTHACPPAASPTPVASYTPTPTATPCSSANPCAFIKSPGFWAQQHPGYTDAQFQSFLNQTDFAPITIAQAQCLLRPSCAHNMVGRAILTAELNVAANPLLGTSVYHLAGSSVNGLTVHQIIAQAYALYHNGQTLPSDLANAIGYISGGALGDGGSGEGQPPGSCRLQEPCGSAITFTDVPAGSPFYSFINCLVHQNIVGGYSDGSFRPGANVTRGQLAKFVSNAAGYSDSIPAGRQTFVDVPPDSPFWVFVERTALHGVVSGYSDHTFRPGNSVTRGQVAKFVSNAAGYNEAVPATRQTFSDVPASDTFWLYIERVYAHGVVSGYSDRTFRAGAGVTRGQTSKFIANTFFPNCSPIRR